MIRRFALVACLVVGGCVTETTGQVPATDAKRVQAQLDLARGYLEGKEFARARRPLNHALEIDPRSAEAHVLLGVLNEREGEPKLAEASYRDALRYDPGNSQALNNYAGFLYGRERYEEAVTMLRRLVLDADYPPRAQAYENLGMAELKVGERARARAAFERSLSFSNGQPRSNLELATLAFEDGDYEDAQKYYDSFRTLARQNVRSLCLGMKLGQLRGDADQESSYRLALKNLYPDSAEAQSCQAEP